MTRTILGIDIAEATLEVSLLTALHSARGQFTNDAQGFGKLTRWLRNRLDGPLDRQVEVYLEATGPYWEALAHSLHEQGCRVSVINPKLIKRHAEATMQRNKTDPQDARTIAAYGRVHRPRAWQPPAPAYRELRAMVRHLAALQSDRQRERNRLEASGHAATVRAAIDAHLAFLDDQIMTLEAQIETHIAQHPALQAKQARLTSIPGIGATCAATFLAEVPDVSRFAQAAQLAAYAGLTPGQRQSGRSLDDPGHLVKWGNAHLRRVLYMPALSAHQWNPIIAAFRARLEARGKSKMTIVVAVMRKLLHLCYGVLKTGKPFDPEHASMAHTP
ncbi:MAG: IS110 family transposase [Chloroflexota bacterium]|nr:IS110 family transposase [Chloroflexota bacterium]